MATKRPINEVEMTEELEQLVGKWFNVLNRVKALAAEEGELRQQLFSHFYPDTPEGAGKRNAEGAELFAMPGGYVLEIKRVINTRVDQSMVPMVIKELADMPPDPETGEQFSIDGVLKGKYEFSDSGYKTCSPEIREAIDKALTRAPGSPQLKLEFRASQLGKVKAKSDTEGE